MAAIRRSMWSQIVHTGVPYRCSLCTDQYLDVCSFLLAVWQEYVVSVMLISVLNIKLTCEWHKAIQLNYINTRTNVVVVLRVTKQFTCAVAARNALEPAVDKDGQCAAYGYYVTRTRYSTWNRKKTTLFSGLYLRNRSTLDIGVLGYIGIF